MRKLGRTKYGKVWQHIDERFYEKIFTPKPLIVKDFIEFLERHRNDTKTILEIGCGAGMYPIKYKHLFEGIDYTGIDIGEPAIKYCKSHSDFDFGCVDILNARIDREFDVVFAHSVIDHVYDINGFLRRVVTLCKKHAYITAYRGYHDELSDHNMTWNNNDGCYYNDLSVPKVKNVLMASGLSEDQFVLRKQESGLALNNNPLPVGLEPYELVIEIHK